MRVFTQQQQVSAVKRLTYSGSPSKGVLGTVSSFTPTCYLRPLSEEASAQNSLQWGTGFTIITEIGIDIRVGDILTIGGVDYTVRGMAVHNRGGNTAYQKYLATKALS